MTTTKDAKDALTTVQDALATIRATAASLRDAIADKQGQIDQLTGEIDRLRALPICFDDWLVFLRKWIDTQAATPAPGILSIRVGDREHVKPLNERPWQQINAQGDMFFGAMGNPTEAGPWNQDGMSAFGALCFYFPDQVFAKLSEHYRAAVGDTWGNEEHPRVAEREKRITEMREHVQALDAEIEELRAQLAPLVNAARDGI